MKKKSNVGVLGDNSVMRLVCGVCHGTVGFEDKYCGSCGAKLNTEDLVDLRVSSILKSIEQIEAFVKICDQRKVSINADTERALTMCREAADAVRTVMEKYNAET